MFIDSITKQWFTQFNSSWSVGQRLNARMSWFGSFNESCRNYHSLRAWISFRWLFSALFFALTIETHSVPDFCAFELEANVIEESSEESDESNADWQVCGSSLVPSSATNVECCNRENSQVKNERKFKGVQSSTSLNTHYPQECTTLPSLRMWK